MDVYKFFADWCGPCKMVAPKIKEAAEAVGVAVHEVNIDEDKDLVEQFGVMSIPTVIVAKDGKEIDRLIGTKSEIEYKQLFERYLTS